CLFAIQDYPIKKDFDVLKGFFHIFVIYSICLSNLSVNTDLGATPTCLSTISPFLKNNNAGMLRIPYFTEISAFKSTLTFPTIALPSYSLAISSTIGPIIRQGPHHSAQKSIK